MFKILEKIKGIFKGKSKDRSENIEGSKPRDEETSKEKSGEQKAQDVSK